MENNLFNNHLPRQLAGTPPSKGGELITSPFSEKLFSILIAFFFVCDWIYLISIT
jgi:hypothetical protein